MGQNLITSGARVQIPVIRVKIGEYEFGVYDKNKNGKIKFPNYIESLEIKKINGLVNTYNLNLKYPINEFNDPNFFEKVFSSVSESRKIEFSYGDASVPKFLYRNEVGIITKVTSRFNLDSCTIDYTINAVSQAILTSSGTHTFPAQYDKPSNIIINLLKKDSKYNLTDIFTGMKNITLVENLKLIPHDDGKKQLETKTNMTVLEYLQYLVDSMNPNTKDTEVNKPYFYVLTFVDNTSDELSGSYFKIVKVDSNISHPEAYQLDIGYPGTNYVFNFGVENDANYSLYYNYQKNLNDNEYVNRINEDGDYEEVYAPIISSNNYKHKTEETDKTWWTKVTQFPIKATVSIKGLLRPAILMTYVRLNIIMFGKTHINSGLYIITRQVDRVDGSNGYITSLSMTRIAD